jgi:hypothetical protein
VTDSCLRHFQFAQPLKFAEIKTNIARNFSAFFANAARNGIELPTTNMTFPRDYIFLYWHNDLHNLRGQSPLPKPDAANPRQVDAVVMPVRVIIYWLSSA